MIFKKDNKAYRKKIYDSYVNNTLKVIGSKKIFISEVSLYSEIMYLYVIEDEILFCKDSPDELFFYNNIFSNENKLDVLSHMPIHVYSENETYVYHIHYICDEYILISNVNPDKITYIYFKDSEIYNMLLESYNINILINEDC